MRERLTELISKYDFDSTQCNFCNRADDECLKCGSECLADYLLDNGVVVLPCKVGDTVYEVCKALNIVLPYFIENLQIRYDTENSDGYFIYEANYSSATELVDCIDFEPSDIGKTVFLAREEAEQALERSKQ